MVYDITKYSSFQSVGKWLKELKTYADASIIIMVIGNKSDLEDQREVPKEQAEEYAKTHNLVFLETSALDNSNVDAAFDRLINDIEKQVKISNPSLLQPKKKKEVKKGKVLSPQNQEQKF